MNEQQIKHFEEIILKAVQSGKQETSSLVDLVIHRIEPAIDKAVEKYVNGKIKNIEIKLDEYIKQDNKWKEDIMPHIETIQEFRHWTSISGFIARGLLLTGGVITAIYTLIKWIKQ